MSDFQLPINQIIQGDCLEVMRGWPDKCVDLIVTDPPYEVGKASWDKLPVGSLKEAWRVCKDSMVVFWSAFDLRRVEDEIGEKAKNVCVWHKPNVAALYMFDRCRMSAQWEPIFYFSKSRKDLANHHTDVFSFNSLPRLHPTEKPVDLVSRLIHTIGGDLVCDPFAGSGTTLVAAKQLGRKYIGIEIEPKYVAICKERLKQEQLPL